ncbi:MAG: TVP38/TMEM64 family protein [Acidimicrobiia bacterium]
MNVWIRRGVIVGIWLGVIIAFQVYRVNSGLNTTDALQQFVQAASGAWWAVLFYVAIYLLRPVLLIPGALLTVVGGMLFGAWLGIPVVLLAANGSAMVAFGIGMLVIGPRSAIEQAAEASTVRARWAARMRRNAFTSILLMRLLFLPYDLVSYTAGMLRMRWQPFLAANALGILPGTIAFVLLGASVNDLSEGVGGVNGWALGASIGLFIVSLAISRLVKPRAPESETT